MSFINVNIQIKINPPVILRKNKMAITEYKTDSLIKPLSY